MDWHYIEKAYGTTSSLSWKEDDDWLVMSAPGTGLLSGGLCATYLCWRFLSGWAMRVRVIKLGRATTNPGDRRFMSWFVFCHRPVICYCSSTSRLWGWISIDKKLGRVDKNISKPFQILTYCSFRARARIFMIGGWCTGQTSLGPLRKKYPLRAVLSKASTIKVGKPSGFA